MLDDPPNINSGTPWSEQSDRDLRWCVEHGRSVEYIADFLCRTRAEVRERMAELGLREQTKA
jgi:hypothetical protein